MKGDCFSASLLEVDGGKEKKCAIDNTLDFTNLVNHQKIKC